MQELISMINKIYKKIYSNLSPNIQGQLSKIVFEVLNKPSAKTNSIGKFPNGCKGGLTISADFELAWAWRFNKKSKNPLEFAIHKAKQARENFPKFLELFEEFNIPITWATVGHLFLDKCSHGDHDWMNKIPYFDDHWVYQKGGWFDDDPYSNYISAPEWYAPDLLEKILNSSVKHEIGCHSFSHINFKDSVCPKNVANDELKACIDAAEKWGIELKSFVFPGHTNGNYSALAKNGFTNYRERNKFDLWYPEVGKANLIRTPSSFGFEYLGYNWSKEYYIYRYKKYIDKSIQTNTLCQPWFHPSMEPVILQEIMPVILQYIADLRDQGVISVMTMSEAANLVLECNKFS